MADGGSVNFVFKADASDAVAGAKQVQVSFDRVEASAKKLARSAKDAGGGIAEGMGRAKASADGMVASFGNMATALNQGMELASKFGAILDDIAKKQAEISSGGRAIGKSGMEAAQASPVARLDGAGREQVTKAAASMARSQGITPDKAMEAIAASASANPTGDAQTWIHDARMGVAQGKAAGVDDPGKLAETRARLRAAGVPEEKLSDMTAFGLQYGVDPGSKQVLDAIGAGMSPESALAAAKLGRAGDLSSMAGQLSKNGAKFAGGITPDRAAAIMMEGDPAIAALAGQVAGSNDALLATRRGMGAFSTQMNRQDAVDAQAGRKGAAKLNADSYAAAADIRQAEADAFAAEHPVVGSAMEKLRTVTASPASRLVEGVSGARGVQDAEGLSVNASVPSGHQVDIRVRHGASRATPDAP